MGASGAIGSTFNKKKGMDGALHHPKQNAGIF